MGGERKAKITVALDRGLLRRVDAVAEGRGDSRSAVIERMLGNGVGEEELFLKAMENPVTRTVAEVVTSSPWLIEKIVRLVGEEMAAGGGEAIRKIVAEQADRGAARRGSEVKKSGRPAGEGA